MLLRVLFSGRNPDLLITPTPRRNKFLNPSTPPLSNPNLGPVKNADSHQKQLYVQSDLKVPFIITIVHCRVHHPNPSSTRLREYKIDTLQSILVVWTLSSNDTKLNNAKISELKSEAAERGRPAEGHDTQIDGLGIVLHPSGKGVWRINYEDPITRRRRRKKFGYFPALAITQARQIASEKFQMVALGLDPFASPDDNGALTIERAWKRDAGSDHEMERLSALQSAWAGWLFWGAARIFGFRVEVTWRDAAPAGPMILLMRHASVADTVLAGVFVTGEHGIRLRYVLKHELLWDPCLDVVGNRLPNYFVRRGSADPARELEGVRSLLEGLAAREGVLIYPEGTRFTLEKRARVLNRLRERGDQELFARAQRLRHTLPPRIGGTLSLLEHNPGLDVVIAAHVGFDKAGTFWDLWNGALRGALVRAEFRRIPYHELPRDRAELTSWLFEQWELVDEWVAENSANPATRGGPDD